MLATMRFVYKIAMILSSTPLVKPFICDTIDTMSSKPARTRKALNRDPKSLALPASLPLIEPEIPEQVIDPQLFALHDNEAIPTDDNSTADVITTNNTPLTDPFTDNDALDRLNKLPCKLQNKLFQSYLQLESQA